MGLALSRLEWSVCLACLRASTCQHDRDDVDESPSTLRAALGNGNVGSGGDTSDSVASFPSFPFHLLSPASPRVPARPAGKRGTFPWTIHGPWVGAALLCTSTTPSRTRTQALRPRIGAAVHSTPAPSHHDQVVLDVFPRGGRIGWGRGRLRRSCRFEGAWWAGRRGSGVTAPVGIGCRLDFEYAAAHPQHCGNPVKHYTHYNLHTPPSDPRHLRIASRAFRRDAAWLESILTFASSLDDCSPLDPPQSAPRSHASRSVRAPAVTMRKASHTSRRRDGGSARRGAMVL
ncbi:hypothetical protein B0H12DRAFT_299484 [Mycena haematopus]|nr:hypothetical protein B0H12DRAFT_299484 [Mycena haematopus]